MYWINLIWILISTIFLGAATKASSFKEWSLVLLAVLFIKTDERFKNKKD